MTSRQRTQLSHQRAQDGGSTHRPQLTSGKLPGYSSCPPKAAWPQAGAVQWGRSTAGPKGLRPRGSHPPNL